MSMFLPEDADLIEEAIAYMIGESGHINVELDADGHICYKVREGWTRFLTLPDRIRTQIKLEPQP